MNKYRIQKRNNKFYIQKRAWLPWNWRTLSSYYNGKPIWYKDGSLYVYSYQTFGCAYRELAKLANLIPEIKIAYEQI